MKFRPIIRSRHPSHNILRPKFKNLNLFNKRVIIRLGSTHNKKLKKSYLDINSVVSCKNSADKRIMKQLFLESNISSPKFKISSIEGLKFPIIAKRFFGSKGKGMVFLKNETDYKLLEDDYYIFEEYFSGVREYRLHITKNRCFYTNRKMLKSNSEKRYFRNSLNSVWIKEENPLFDKPINWNDIEQESIRSLHAVGLDIGACDVRVQSKYNNNNELRNNPTFKIIEINSAPSFGELTTKCYINELNNLIKNKIDEKI